MGRAEEQGLTGRRAVDFFVAPSGSSCTCLLAGRFAYNRDSFRPPLLPRLHDMAPCGAAELQSMRVQNQISFACSVHPAGLAAHTMKNPWLDVPLDDYESHMALSHVGQAQLLSQLLGEAIETYQPLSIALLSCAGGNGLERIPATSVKRVVGIDINQRYLDRAAARYRDHIPLLQLFAGDLGVDRFIFEPVDLVFAGLIFEYVDPAQLFKQALSMLVSGGRLVSVLQLPSSIEEVTPSPYTTLKSISSVLRVVPHEKLSSLAIEAGFDVELERVVAASGGKTFQVNTFRSATPSNPRNPTG